MVSNICIWVCWNQSCFVAPPFPTNCSHLYQNTLLFALAVMLRSSRIIDLICELWYWNCVCLVTQSCLTLCDPMDCSPPGSSVYGDCPGKNSGVGCHAFLQGIFPTQGSNPADSLPSDPPRKQRILEWTAYPFSRASSRPRDWTGFSSIAGRFITLWTTRESQNLPPLLLMALFLNSSQY